MVKRHEAPTWQPRARVWGSIRGSGSWRSGQVGGDEPPRHVGEGRCLTCGLAVSSLQEAETMVQKIRQQQYTDLLFHDQLLMERKEQKVFLHFGENCSPLLPGPPVILSPLFPDILTRGRVMLEEGNLVTCELWGINTDTRVLFGFRGGRNHIRAHLPF